MCNLYVSDIGDGLAAGLKINGFPLQIDCGSTQSPEEAYKKGLIHINPKYFILSHFHADHYNGLLEGLKPGNSKFNIEKVYFPRLPEFPKNQESRIIDKLNCNESIPIR